MNKREAYKMVFDDLCKCNMFVGIYDAKNGDDHFMSGICTVMEAIANAISEEEGDNFVSKFFHNMDESEKKVEEIT